MLAIANCGNIRNQFYDLRRVHRSAVHRARHFIRAQADSHLLLECLWLSTAERSGPVTVGRWHDRLVVSTMRLSSVSAPLAVE